MMAERNDTFTAGAPHRRAVLPPIAAGVRLDGRDPAHRPVVRLTPSGALQAR
jgi:hypothetical protein